MRNSISILFTLILSLIISAKGVAQINVSWGALHSHSVDFAEEYGKAEGAIYHWHASGGTLTDLSGVTASSVDIIWDGEPGEHEISVYVIDGNGCQSETISQKINVLEESTLLFDNPTSAALCAALNNGPGEGATITFTVEFNSGIAPYSLTYRIVDNENHLYDRTGNETTENIHIDGILSNSYDIIIENGFINNTGIDQEYKIEILEAKTSDGAVITLDENMQSFIIHKKPMIQNLIMH